MIFIIYKEINNNKIILNISFIFNLKMSKLCRLLHFVHYYFYLLFFSYYREFNPFIKIKNKFNLY